MDHSPYLNDALTRQDSMLECAMQTLDEHKDKFDAIVCTGISGLLVGPTLAYMLSKRLAIVRKDCDRNNHATERVESGLNKKDRWIFVDDLIASGETIRHVERTMNKLIGFEGKMAGHYLYNSDCWAGGQWMGGEW